MTNPDDFNKDNDDFTTPSAGDSAADNQNAKPDSGETSGDATNANASLNSDENTADASAASSESTDSRGDKAEDSDADLPQLLRDFSHVLAREFRSAAADSGLDPRDFGRMRRGRRHRSGEDVVADGAAYPDEPVTYGPPRGRGGWGPSKNIDPEELRQRFRDMRDGVGGRVEEVLTSEEFENLKTALSKIVDNFSPDRCDDDSEHRGEGCGRRGFGPSFGPGLGAGRRGFDPFGRHEERRSREQEIQDAFERGFKAGFEQGRSS